MTSSLPHRHRHRHRHRLRVPGSHVAPPLRAPLPHGQELATRGTWLPSPRASLQASSIEFAACDLAYLVVPDLLFPLFPSYTTHPTRGHPLAPRGVPLRNLAPVGPAGSSSRHPPLDQVARRRGGTAVSGGRDAATVPIGSYVGGYEEDPMERPLRGMGIYPIASDPDGTFEQRGAHPARRPVAGPRKNAWHYHSRASASPATSLSL